MKRFLFIAALVLSLVGGAGQVSADPGTPPTVNATVTTSSAGASWEGLGFGLSAGISWE